MNFCGQNGDLWEFLDDGFGTMRCGEQAEQDNDAWLYAMFYKNFDSLDDSIASTEYWVHEQNLSPVDVWWELGVVHFGSLRLLVALYQDLPNADRSAAVS